MDVEEPVTCDQFSDGSDFEVPFVKESVAELETYDLPQYEGHDMSKEHE